jgi:hypothetical protein
MPGLSRVKSHSHRRLNRNTISYFKPFKHLKVANLQEICSKRLYLNRKMPSSCAAFRAIISSGSGCSFDHRKYSSPRLHDAFVELALKLT